jgi:hypothetical protein
MKKIIYATLFIISSSFAFSQAGTKYATGGNSNSPGDIFGTTNNQPINFTTNNTLKMVLDVNGNLRIVSFAGSGNRVVLTDVNGNLINLPQGSANQVLFGNGTWGNLPSSATTWSLNGNNLFSTNSGSVTITSNFVFGSAGTLKNNAWVGATNRLMQTDVNGNVTPFAMGNPNQVLYGNGTWGVIPSPTISGVWNTNGNSLYYNGNVGINTNTPTVALDVNGDLKVSNNLYVGGGIVITDAIRADTVHMDSLSLIKGNTNIVGDVSATGDVAVSQSLSVVGDVTTGSKLSVGGNATFNNNLSVNSKLLVGAGADALTMKYVQGNQSFPPMFKFAAPAGSGPIGGPPGGGIGAEDSTPDLSCLTGTGTAIPGFLNTFSQMLSVAYNPTNNAIPGGQILMGHNGINAFFETQGTGAAPGNLNHPGDLFINKHCNRNVLFFSHAVPFGAGLTNIVSVDGSLNVRTKMQLGNYSSQTFTEPLSRLYILSDVGSVSNGIKIKHGANGNTGIKIATYNDATAFIVSKSPNFNNDGNETFKIEGDGKTQITTTNSVAFFVQDASNNNADNFHVNANGQTFVGNPLQTNGSMLTVAQPNKNALAFTLTDNTNSPNKDFFNVYGNGYTEIKVYTPATMPKPYGTLTERVFTVRDVLNNKDLFVVAANGKVYSREVEISLQTTFPDYVFSKDYKLKPLSEVEDFIKKNQHLPNFEKGSYYEKNGINVTDLLLKQQQTIEELTLYNIELQKQNLEIEKRLKALEEKK